MWLVGSRNQLCAPWFNRCDRFPSPLDMHAGEVNHGSVAQNGARNGSLGSLGVNASRCARGYTMHYKLIPEVLQVASHN